jgi:hypothetical protein
VIFVPDLTFIGTRRDRERPTPNPNVLIEYGWALKKLGYDRIIPVMNIAFGKPEGDAMPFNMRHLRNPIAYECPEEGDEPTRVAARKELARKLEQAIRAVIESAEFRSSLPKPAPPKLFTLRDPQDEARFRPQGQRLGVSVRTREPIFLRDGPATWLRLMPKYDPERVWSRMELEEALNGPPIILPIQAGRGGFGSIRDTDGFGTVATCEDKTTRFVAYLFQSGEIWSIDSRAVNATAVTRSVPLDEAQLTRALEQFELCLRRLGVVRPLHWIAGIEGIEGRGLWRPNAYTPVGNCVIPKIVVRGTLENGQSAGEALEPFFAEIYELCGLRRC